MSTELNVSPDISEVKRTSNDFPTIFFTASEKLQESKHTHGTFEVHS